MSRVLLALAAALACFVGAARWHPRSTPAVVLARNLARPLLLPFLWQDLEQAERTLTPGEVVERGRLLLRFLPRWLEGHLLFADMLAFDVSKRAHTADAALDALLGALLFLEQATEICPDHADEILMAMATFLEIRSEQDPELAAAFRSRFGQDPLERTKTYLERAAKIHPSASLHDRRAYLTERLVGTALRTGDRDEAIALIDRAQKLLASARNRANAARHIEALRRLRAFLAGDRSITLESLKADPLLAPLVARMQEGR